MTLRKPQERETGQNKMRRSATYVLLVTFAAPWLLNVAAWAQGSLSGVAHIVDGDTIKIDGMPIRLDGIDAPEQRQTCTDHIDREISCGKRATKALALMIGVSPVRCEISGKDSYDRLLGECYANGGSLNRQMVRRGWALAFVKYSVRFVAEEQRARLLRAGLWQWRFDAPWTWRAGILRQAVGSSRDAPGECVIKGNISRNGTRIYHMPFHQHYDRTRINESQGEKWFCTEGEAQAAGWRRALR